MAYVVDPARFKAEGALLDWAFIARRLNTKYDGRKRQMLQLRWMTAVGLGMPTEPFVVWRRPKGQQFVKNLGFSSHHQIWLFGSSTVNWIDGPMAQVMVDVQATLPGTVYAYAGSPHISNAVATADVPVGASTVTLKASTIDGLVTTPGMNVTAVRGVPLDQLTGAAGWRQYEIVGLPVPKPDWDDLSKHALKQGMVASLTTPQDAARQRLERGGPQVGWQSGLLSGQAVPPWSPPSISQLVLTEIRSDIIDKLQLVLPATPPNQQLDEKLPVTLPPPENSSGKKMSGGNRTTQVSPLAVTLMGAGSDPWLALALGFGTAYDAAGGVNPLTGKPDEESALNYDYMVTARWEKGLDGDSDPFEMAAVVPSPALAIPPPLPANLSAEVMGQLRPLSTDADWRCSVKASWDRPPDMELFRPRTYAFMRTGLLPPEPTVALMPKRQSGGYRYLLINSALPTPLPPDWWRVAAVDRELIIPSVNGQRGLRYGVAHQDIYGQWTPWVVADTLATQPPVDDVRIVHAKLDAALPLSPGGSVCDGTLTLEFLWDWRMRSPQQIRFVGRLYAAAQRDDPPPSFAVPGLLERTLAGTGTSLDITFAGDVPSAPGATFVALSEDGEHSVPFGPAQGDETRRYRVTLTDFSLDFASTPHIALALWANATERIPPQRVGDWSDEPSLIAVSDPRPPKLIPDVVTLASLPDASGECHARLSWTASANAAGYFIYEATETNILEANGMPAPPPDDTLSQRLAKIKQLFAANPSRREFTRRNDKPITALSTDITLPRGSTNIHVFVVIGVNAGQVESAWPAAPNADDALQAFAAPRVMKPAPPTIEVAPSLDNSVTPPVYRARVQVGVRPGPRVRKVELFRVRVDDAAKDLDTMGPSVATVTGSGAGWTVTKQIDDFGANIETATGFDTPTGSWKRVWYRAVAWSDPDPLRGYLAGRSLASSAAWVVVPPSDPPDLSAVTVSWPAGGALGDVLLRWTSSAPLRKMPLGPHTLTVRAWVKGATPLIETNSSLDALPTTAPVADSGVWVTDADGPSPFEYAAVLRRLSPDDAVQVIIRLTDPLGRSSERLVGIPSGPILPAPDLSNFVLTNSTNPAGKMLTWNSDSPYALNDPSPYVLRVTAFRRSNFPFITLTPVTFQMPLPGVPLDEPGPVPPGTDQLRVRRVPGASVTQGYYAFCRVAVTRFVVRLTSPDGRVAEETIQAGGLLNQLTEWVRNLFTVSR